MAINSFRHSFFFSVWNSISFQIEKFAENVAVHHLCLVRKKEQNLKKGIWPFTKCGGNFCVKSLFVSFLTALFKRQHLLHRNDICFNIRSCHSIKAIHSPFHTYMICTDNEYNIRANERMQTKSTKYTLDTECPIQTSEENKNVGQKSWKGKLFDWVRGGVSA